MIRLLTVSFPCMSGETIQQQNPDVDQSSDLQIFFLLILRQTISGFRTHQHKVSAVEGASLFSFHSGSRRAGTGVPQ